MHAEFTTPHYSESEFRPNLVPECKVLSGPVSTVFLRSALFV